MEIRTWTKDQFVISTDTSLIPIDELAEVFASDDFYWAKALPTEAMSAMLQNSLCFGVYETLPSSNLEQIKTTATSRLIGFARCVTDFVTFAYLTDVWVKPACQGHGLGKWLVGCVHEVLQDMPHLRRALLFTGDWERSVPFYEKLLGMSLLDVSHGKGLAIMECKGKGHPSYGAAGSGYT